MKQIIQQRNNVLSDVGIDAAYFGSGLFVMAEAKSGCQIFVSCYNDEHAIETRDKLQQFLGYQQGE